MIRNIAIFPLNTLGRISTRNTSTYVKRKDGWESVIGLEIHAQIDSKSKLFSFAPVKFANSTNASVDYFDASIPGTLPILNRKCVEAGVLTALALSCQLNERCYFDRKHYFYSDLPAGYQITQQREPLAKNGFVDFVVFHPGTKLKPYYHRSKIKQLQLEQDSGKSFHDENSKISLIDLNRAGIGLMELVFEPDLRDGEEAGSLVKELILILQTLNTCNCKLEEGSFRVDANISINRKGEDLGIRTEVKNLSSVRSLVNAIEFEVNRQIELLQNGGVVVNETRSFDSQSKMTLPMRDKEAKQDYRFMPEPNLFGVKLINDFGNQEESSQFINVSHVEKRIKELPDASRRRLMDEFGLSIDFASTIIHIPGFKEYFLAVMSYLERKSGKRVFDILQTPFLQYLNESNLTFNECKANPKYVAEIVELLEENVIHINKAKELAKLIYENENISPKKIVIEKNWIKLSDEKEIEKICQAAIDQNSKIVAKYLKRKEQKLLVPLFSIINDENDGNIDMKKVVKCVENILNAKEK